MAADDLLDRFLNGCEEIKESLGRQSGTRFKGLGEAVRKSEDHPVVKLNLDTLNFLVDLRNTIQHSRRLGGKPIATPRLDAVEAIEGIAEQIERPLRVNKFMVRGPLTVTEDTPLPEVARTIVSHSLSQLPVVDRDGRFEWLLTTNALARWMGAKYEADDGALIEEGGTVADVRPWAETHDVAETVPPTYHARKACNRLTSANAPTALVVTSDGKRTGEIAGILTRFDVPRMLSELNVRLNS